MKHILSFLLLFVLCGSIYSRNTKRILHTAQYRFETILKENVEKKYWNDAEIQMFRNSKWWNLFQCQNIDSIYVRLQEVEGNIYIWIFNDSHCCILDTQNGIQYYNDLSENDELEVLLIKKWDKSILECIEGINDCPYECAYEVIFKVMIREKKVTSVDYVELKGFSSPNFELAFFISKEKKEDLDTFLEKYLEPCR